MVMGGTYNTPVIEGLLDEDFVDKDEYHLYICSDCMEKALGRKLLKTDLIGENIQFNKDFENNYFI